MNIPILLTTIFLSLLTYHYIGYPLLLFVWAKIWPRKNRQVDITPTVSILVAAYNEEDVIAQKLDSCIALNYPKDKLEIIVVSDGSIDQTVDIVGRYAGRHSEVIFIPKEVREGKSRALNTGAERATGDILVISDANAMLDPDAIRLLVRNFADPQVGCVSGSRHLLSGENGGIEKSSGLYWRYESAIKRWESKTGSTVGVLGSMLAIRQTLFRPIPSDIINDDFYIMLSALNGGQRKIYEPEAVCGAYASQSTRQEKVRRKRISAGRFQHLLNFSSWIYLPQAVRFRLISHKYLRLFLFPIMIGALLSNGVAVWLNPTINLGSLLLIAQVTFYLLALLGKFVKGGPLLGRLSSVAYYIVAGSIASLEGFWGYLSGTQTVLWTKAGRSSGTFKVQSNFGD